MTRAHAVRPITTKSTKENQPGHETYQQGILNETKRQLNIVDYLIIEGILIVSVVLLKVNDLYYKVELQVVDSGNSK